MRRFNGMNYTLLSPTFLLIQMPATPPLTFEKSTAPIEEITPTGGLSHFAGTGKGFTQRFDKLVIAVGAYAQSKLGTAG
jgi:hypothetical protein